MKIDTTTKTGAKFTSSLLIVVVQQKSRGSLKLATGPSGGRTGGEVVALMYGFGTTHKSDDQTRTCIANVLSGRYMVVRRKVTITTPQWWWIVARCCSPSYVSYA